MRKWFRILLSLLLVFTVTGTYLSPVAQAEDSAISFKFTGVIAWATDDVALTLDTNINFSDYGVADDMSQLFWSYPSVGSAESNSAKEAATYPWSGTYVYFYGIFSDINNPSYVKINAGTTFSWGGKTFQLTEDFTITNDGSGWSVYTQPIEPDEPDEPIEPDEPVETTKVKLTGISLVNRVTDPNDGLYGLTQMVFTTDHTWQQAGSATGVSDGIKINSGTFQLDGLNGIVVESAGSKALMMQHWNGGYMTSGAKVKIPAGLQFTIGDTTYEVAENFGFTYDGGTTGTKVETIPLTFTGIYTSETSGNNLALTTNIDFGANYGWQTFDGPFTEDNQVLINGAGQDTTIYYLYDKHIFFEGILSDTTSSATVEIKKGTWLTKGGKFFEVTGDFNLRYDETAQSWGQVFTETDITLTEDVVTTNTGLTIATGLDVDAASSLVGMLFATNGISVNGDNTKITTVTIKQDGSLVIDYIPSTGDVLKVVAGSTCTSAENSQKLTVTNANHFVLRYNGTNWVKHIEPTLSEAVTILGTLITTDTDIFLQTNISSEHAFANQTFSTSDIQILRDNEVIHINSFLMHPDSGVCNVTFSYWFEAGDIVTIKEGGVAINESNGYEICFANEYALKYNGTAWTEYEQKVTVSGITAESPSELYLTTGLGADHELYADNTTYSSQDLSITKRDGTVRYVDIRIDKGTGALYLASHSNFEEGDVCRIKANGTATNDAKKFRIRFVNKLTLYFEKGAWHIDNEGPEFYYQDKLVTSSTTVTATAGRSKASFEKAFYAKDEIRGIVELAFTYADGALNNNVLCAGTWNITMRAVDDHDNETVQTVRVVVDASGLLGDSNYDDVLAISDLVRLKKAINYASTDVAIYDMSGDDAISQTDAEYMRYVLVGAYSVVAGQTVALPTYTGSAVLFADCPPSQLAAESVQEYFDAGFTHMQMTEDYTALTYNGNTPFSDYINAIKRIQKYGDVMVRNQYGDADYFVNATEKSLSDGKVTIPVRNLTTEFADLGVQSFYYDDEPWASEFTQLQKLVNWHNTYNKGAMFHVNLLPSYSNASAFGGTFKQYIQKYVDDVLTKVDGKKTLSIDNYPLRYESGKKFIRTSYLSDFLTVAQAVKNFNLANPDSPAEVSFCIQSYGVPSGNKGNRQIASLADIRFQTNMAIALGARNMEYYRYLSAVDTDGTITEYAMVQNGAKTAVYDYVQTANKEIQAWDHVFTSFDWQGTRMYGDTSGDLYKNASGQFISTFAKLSVSSATRATVVSEFIDKSGNYAYMAVNATDPSTSYSTSVTFTLTGAKQAVVYQNGVASVKTLTNGALNLQLGAGEGAFCIPIY